MIVYPAMDLMDGRCVRLAQGRFDAATTYPAEPTEALARFARTGAAWAHVVDLDGARAGAPRQHDLLAELAAAAPLKLQVAGGFRTRDQVARMLGAGAGRVVIGSLAVKDPPLVSNLLDEFGSDRITLALDVNMAGGVPIVAAHGWTENSGTSLWDISALYPAALHILITDIARDGMLSGPSLALIEECFSRLPGWQIQASGGVRDIADLAQLAASGAAGAIVGKALWEGHMDLAEALGLARA